MPCDIGYKTYTPVRIPQPKPQVVKKSLPAPSVDADLLDKLGIDDKEFLSWISNLDIIPLLEEALKRTLETNSPGKIKFSITKSGGISTEYEYTTQGEKIVAEALAEKTLSNWQIQIFQIVTELLGYDTVIKTESSSGNEVLTLVAEEYGKTHPCKYIRVSKSTNGNGEITFEHFDTPEDLEKEKVKFTALSQKLGIKIGLTTSPITGQPPPTTHDHAHDHQHGHGHTHKHEE